jgi:hypothetical protein
MRTDEVSESTLEYDFVRWFPIQPRPTLSSSSEGLIEGHVAIPCPRKPKRQVNQVNINQVESSPLLRVNNCNTLGSYTDPC